MAVAVVMMIMTVTATWHATMTHSAVTILQAAMTVTTDNDTLTINRATAGAAVVREAAARIAVAMAVISLRGGRGESSQAGDRDGEEGDDLFHDGGRSLF
ncbi:hypothetical protein BGE01nite_07720 [Brevifollis gellanilyticus]|uniref:Secreted protein n=1 Tax=Brevifollis gellanilyticus TaxID=748831 RepID=A0A512M546_9BACT|nr:hypothetical protein BGE01nite_07720 [Brevifollis gellanilyticus]